MSAAPDNLQFDAPTKEPTEMKIPAAIALCALTLTIAGCTTSDDTPPGSVAGLDAAEEGDEPQGIPDEEQSADEGGATGQDEVSATDSPQAILEQVSDPTCLVFFDGGAPLAGRAQDARELLTEGEGAGLSEIDYTEVELLNQQLDELTQSAEDATPEQAELIATVNAPFAEIVRAVREGDAQDEETGEVSYEAIDVADSETAQEEFTQACLESSAEG